MKITEIEWLKENDHLLSPDDRSDLEYLGAFEMIRTGEINLPIMEFVKVVGDISSIVGKYMEKDNSNAK